MLGLDQQNSDLPALLLAALVIILLGVALTLPRRSRRATWKQRHRHPSADRGNPAEQLRAVMTAPFERRRVLSAAEYRVFRIVEAELAANRGGYRVFAQTSLGEVLASPSEDAFHSINSKRADILIVDRGGWPVIAIEHQGVGHFQGSATTRDAIKREALRKAGVRYIEIFDTDEEQQIRSLVREHLTL